MEFIIHNEKNRNIAELKSKELVLKNTQDFIDLLGNATYFGAEAIIIEKSNVESAFFELKTGIAGDILQKFSNYNQKLAIIGDFSNVTSKSLNDFIRESNRVGRVIFVGSKTEAIDRFGK